LLKVNSYNTNGWGTYQKNGSIAFDLQSDRIVRASRSIQIKVKECETGYSTSHALECFAKHSTDNVFVTLPMSTSTASLLEITGEMFSIPTVIAGYGNEFLATNPIPHYFTMGPTYIDAVSVWMESIGPTGKVGYFGHDSPYGKSILPYLETQLGGRLITVMCEHPCSNNTKNGEYAKQFKEEGVQAIYSMPWGSMVESMLEAFQNEGLLQMVTTVWWGTSHDNTLDYAGSKAIVLASTSGSPVPVPEGVSASIFAQGVRIGILMTEVARLAIKRNLAHFTYDKWAPTGEYLETMHASLAMTPAMFVQEAQRFDLTEERINELGLRTFLSPCKLTPTDHSKCNNVELARWTTGGTWETVSN
jgi:branched-chain amino acid transport system substrate-binding protein